MNELLLTLNLLLLPHLVTAYTSLSTVFTEHARLMMPKLKNIRSQPDHTVIEKSVRLLLKDTSNAIRKGSAVLETVEKASFLLVKFVTPRRNTCSPSHSMRTIT